MRKEKSELSLMGQLRKEADRDFNRYLKYVNEIFEENKMLHEELGKLHSLWSKDTKYIQELEEENKNLKSDLEQFSEAYKRYRDFEKEELAESCYDLEEENKKLKEYQYWAKDKIEGLQYENKKLKSDLGECECSFGFESDEVGFWKREYKRLKKWIKDHCKGYGNLFPEDEMKRQWKKADKKKKKTKEDDELIYEEGLY